ncbi:MAG: TrkH family potassium uptake protein [Amphiplicatus sp.]
MIRVVPVFRVLGGLLIGMSLMMTPSLLLNMAAPDYDAGFFILGIVVALFTGLTLLLLSASNEPFDLSRRQAFMITGLSWLVLPAFSAIPFLGEGLTYIEGYFESASGLTSTGATVITGLEFRSPGILLWRSMMHFIGGVGIVFLGIIVMPFLRVGGMQLFKTESSDQSDKIFAKGLDLARWIASVFVGLFFLCAMAYAALGMSAFDAINHALTTVSTGGFSTHDASLGYFNSPAIEWVSMIFMIAGALPFVAYIRFLRGRRDALFSDTQVRGLILFLALASLVMALTHANVNNVDFLDALRVSAFHVTSIVTTTGYATEDYQLWGPFAVGAFFVLTYVGGCSGSTSGGIKVYRMQILAKLAMAHLSRLVSPSHVIVVSYGSRRVDDDIAIGILTFLAAFLISTAVFTVMLAWIGLDLVTALSASVACMSNVGPALGPITGPAGTFAPLPESAKALLAVAMILGRLEFFTLLVMVTPAFWRG